MILHFLPYPFVSLLVICLGIGLLWNQFGYSVLIGVSVLFIILPMQMWLGKLLSKFFAEAAKRTDERIRLMNEFIPAIKIIKVKGLISLFYKLFTNALIYRCTAGRCNSLR